MHNHDFHKNPQISNIFLCSNIAHITYFFCKVRTSTAYFCIDIITSTFLISISQSIPDDEKDDYLYHELWIKENFTVSVIKFTLVLVLHQFTCIFHES